MKNMAWKANLVKYSFMMTFRSLRASSDDDIENIRISWNKYLRTLEVSTVLAA